MKRANFKNKKVSLKSEPELEFMFNVQADNQTAQVRSGFIIGEPQPTCMALPTVKKCIEMGYVGVYRTIVDAIIDNRTISTCKAKSNGLKFTGQPQIPEDKP